MFHRYRWVGFTSVTAATLLAGGGVAANQIIREPVSGSKPPAASSFLMTVADYGSGFAALPKWQQRLLRVRYGTTRLGRSVPAGGEQLFDPRAAASPHAYATPLVLRPASPSNSDITATKALRLPSRATEVRSQIRYSGTRPSSRSCLRRAKRRPQAQSSTHRCG